MLRLPKPGYAHTSVGVSTGFCWEGVCLMLENSKAETGL